MPLIMDDTLKRSPNRIFIILLRSLWYVWTEKRKKKKQISLAKSIKFHFSGEVNLYFFLYILN